MKRASPIIILLGLLIVAGGALQLFLVGVLSPDPKPNPVGPGLLWCACFCVGAIVAAVGLRMGGGKFSRWI
jgi:hypothetical protein